MKPNFSEVYSREKQIFYLINEIEKRGLAFDYKKARRKNKTIKKQLSVPESEMQDVNPNSPAQVLSHLQSLGIPDRLLTKKGKLTTEEKTLQQILSKIRRKKAKEFIKGLLEYRSLKKISSTYLEPLIKKAESNNGIIHCSINPTDTRTGRMASRSPNLLNIPETKVRRTGRTNPVRECFIVRDGFANYYFDYSQMEMGIFGLLAGDERIIKGYQEVDLHDYMAQIIWHQYEDDPKFWRDVTKNINFGIIYGMGIRTMALLYEMKESNARRYYNIYMSEFPSVREYQEECRQRLMVDGYIWDWFGKRYCLSPGEAYKAVNAIVQGSCAQIFKIALIKVSEYLLMDNFIDWAFSTGDIKSNIILPVYDEIQIESQVYKDSRLEKYFINKIIEIMTEIPQLLKRDFRLRVDVKKTRSNWAAKKGVKI